jgi:hypothetical protein
MLTLEQATAVAAYLIARTPGADGELDHRHVSAWQLSCEALEALGYATETARGALLRPTPVLPAVLLRRDDAACVVLSVAEQTGGIRLRHPRSDPNDETGPSTADPETEALLNLLGLTSGGAWTDAATPIHWRTAPEEVRPADDREFSTQVEKAVTHVPDAIWGRIRTIYSEHAHQAVRDHLIDWIFFEDWRWGDGWVTDDRGGRRLGVFHDPLAQRVREAAMARLMGV